MEAENKITELQKRIIELEDNIKHLEFSKQQYKKIIENLPVSVFVKDIQNDYRYIIWNRELEKIFGEKSSKTLGKTDFEFLKDKKDAKQVRLADETVISSEEMLEIPLEEMSTPNGKKIFHTKKYLIFNEDGTPELLVGCLDDITEKVKFEKSLKQSEEMYRLLVENVNEMLLFLDLQGNIILANPATEEISGYPINELQGRNILEFINGESKELIIKNLSKRNSGDNEKFKYQLDIRSKTGKLLFIEAISSPVIKDKEVIGIMFLATDITYQKRTEKKLENVIQHFDIAMDATMSSSFDINLVTGKFKTSLALYNFLDYNENDIPKTLDEFISLVHNDDASNFVRTINDHKSGVTPLYYNEFRVKRKPEGWFWCSGAGKIIERDNENNPVRFVGIFTIIEGRKSAESRLKASEDFNRQITENMVDLISQFNLNFNWIYASPSFQKVLGYQPVELIGKNLFDYVHPEDKDELKLGLENSLKTGEGAIQFRMINNHKEYRWIEAAGKIIFDKHSKPMYSIIGSRDITDRKLVEIALRESEMLLKNQNDEYQVLNQEYVAQNEELGDSFLRLTDLNKQLSKAKAKAEESDKLKSAFLANMSHEIRTPMNAIVGFSDLLKDGGLSADKVEKYVNIIDSNSHQLLALINDIIDISKIEAGQVSLSLSIININELMREMLSIFKTLALKKNIEITLHYTLPNSEANIEADDMRIKQILHNLLNNAMKFTQLGKINFGYTITGKFIQFYVQDTGVGIAAESQKLVFERFRQIENHLTKKVGGTGLGLSISKALVELMGGHMWVTSELGKGSTFFFEIPYVAEAGEVHEGLSSNPVVEVTDWSRYTFLVAEDEEANYFYLEELLRPTSVKIIHAKDGQEAVDMFKANNDIDLVIMDIKMPQKDGYQATREIKSLRNEIPVIAQTAYAMADDRKKAIDAGCDSYVTKPIERKLLLAEIAQALKGEK